MSNQNYHNLACAITLQAVREYFAKGTTSAKRQAILKDLRSSYMSFITGGMSVVVAEKLEKNPKEIRARLKKEDKKTLAEESVAV